MKILIAKFRNIGDVLLITPLLENLEAYYPDCRIDVALNAGTEAMVNKNTHVQHLHIYDRKKLKALPLWQRMKEEIGFAAAIKREKYDLFIGLTEGERTAYLAWYSGAKIKVGYTPKKTKWLQNVYTLSLPLQESRHTVEANLDALRALEIPVRQKKVQMCWDNADEVIPELPEHFVHIHPVSRWLFKCINNEIMAHIIDFVQEQMGYPVVLSAAKDQKELEKVAHIRNLCKTRPLDYSGQLSLHQVAALNKRAEMFIGVDTAIMHISAANNVPVQAFFGPSGVFHWGPWDNDRMESGYNQRNGLQQMGKHRVIQEVRDCIPCGKDGCEGTKISDCLMQLDEKQIFKSIEEMLGKDTHAT